MTRQPRTLKPDTNHEENFANLMLVTAEFVSSRGGIEPAKQALYESGHFIAEAGSVSQAGQALQVLERLKARIDNPAPTDAPSPDVPK